jgi:putative transcriptional regulator
MINCMNIRINLDVEMAKKKISLTELSQLIGISMTNLSLLKTGKVKAVRFSTLEAICKHLGCQPGDLLEYVSDEKADLNQ